MAFLRSSTVCLLAALSGACVLDEREPEPLGQTTLAVKTMTNVTAVVTFADGGSQSITPDGVLHVRDQTFHFVLVDPLGRLSGGMQLLHNADLDLATNRGVGYGVIASMNVTDGSFAGDYAGELINTPAGQLFEGEYQADLATVPRNRHLEGTFSNHATGSFFVFDLATKYTHPAGN